MASNWTRLLHARETGARAGLPALPRPSSGVLVIDEKLTARSLPGGLLAHVSEAVHYLDLGGVEADSLDAFGAPLSLWAGVTKLYASGSGLRTLGHAADHLTAVRFLYLDGNGLEECELRRLLAKEHRRGGAADIMGVDLRWFDFP